MPVYEIRLKETGKAWEDTRPTFDGFINGPGTAKAMAKLLSRDRGTEARLNEKGSVQGHYFTQTGKLSDRDIDYLIANRIDAEYRGKGYTMAVITRELLVAGIRNLFNDPDFLRNQL